MSVPMIKLVLNFIRYEKRKLQDLTANASAMLVASRRSLDTKFLPMPAGTISSSVGGTEFSVNAIP